VRLLVQMCVGPAAAVNRGSAAGKAGSAARRRRLHLTPSELLLVPPHTTVGDLKQAVQQVRTPEQGTSGLVLKDSTF
jgi:hypothetical protein